jgi:hypothetical protein
VGPLAMLAVASDIPGYVIPAELDSIMESALWEMNPDEALLLREIVSTCRTNAEE